MNKPMLNVVIRSSVDDRAGLYLSWEYTFSLPFIRNVIVYLTWIKMGTIFTLCVFTFLKKSCSVQKFPFIKFYSFVQDFQQTLLLTFNYL